MSRKGGSVAEQQRGFCFPDISLNVEFTISRFWRREKAFGYRILHHMIAIFYV